jgi:diguanylate cyclase (GGDEF)-like protein/PAS domain S-box-containing protein
MPQNTNLDHDHHHSPWIAQDAIQLHRLFSDNPQTALTLLGQHPQLQEMLTELLRQSNRYAETIDRYVMATTTDMKGKILTASKAFCDVSGYSAEELIGSNHNIIRHPHTPKVFYKTLWKTLLSGESWHGDICSKSKDGHTFWMETHIDPIVDKQGSIIGYIAIRHDITERKRVEKMSITDELTGCYNRRHFNRLFPEELRRAKRDQHWLAFMMCDADNFKKYNDTYGHHAGDDALKVIGEVLNETFSRASDHVFRLGGEEFAVIFPIQEAEHAQLLADKTLQAMYARNIEHTGNIPHGRLTLSLGMMVLDPSIEYVSDEIYKYADGALYRAKRKGRNRFELVDVRNPENIEFF